MQSRLNMVENKLFHISAAHTQSTQTKQKAKQHKTIGNIESTSIQACSGKEHLKTNRKKKHHLLDASVSRSEIVCFSRLHKGREICRLFIVRCITVGALLSGVNFLDSIACSQSWSGGSKRRGFRRGRDAGSKSARTSVFRANSSMMGMGISGSKQSLLLLGDTNSLGHNSCGTLWQGRCFLLRPRLWMTVAV